MTSRMFRVGFLTLFFAVAVWAFAETISVEGVLHEWETDDSGDVIAVYLEADEEGFIVSNEGKGKELIALVGKKVSVKGTTYQDEEDYLYIKVTSYEVLGE